MPLEIAYKRALRGPCMKLVFTLTNKLDDPESSAGEVGQGQFNIDDLVDIRLQFDQKPPTSDCDKDNLPVYINMSSRKTEKGDNITVKLNILHTKTNVSKTFICTDAWTDWVEIGSGECKLKNSVYTLDDVELIFTVTKAGSVTFADLYDDTDIIDFNLSLDDNRVPVHKACLAAHSQEFKTMFTSVWKDINEGCIEVLNSIYKKNIQRLTKTFLTLSLSDVAARVQLAGPAQAETVILNMIEEGEIYAMINQKDGMVVFLDSPEKFESPDNLCVLEQQMAACTKFHQHIQEMDEQIQVNPQYVKKSVGSHDEEMPPTNTKTTYSM